MNHASVQFFLLHKNFYDEVHEVAKMTKEEVDSLSTGKHLAVDKEP